VGERAAPALAAIEAADGAIDGAVGEGLGGELGGGLDAQAAREHGLLAEAVDQLAADVLGVVGGALAEDVRLAREGEGLRAGFVALLSVDVAGVDHGLEDDAAAALRGLGAEDGAVARGGAGEPGDQGALGEGELVEALAKVPARRGGDAVGAVTEEDLVEVDLEDHRLAEL
jgi:hypothetical protein